MSTSTDIRDLIRHLKDRRPGAVRDLVARAHPRLRELAGKLLRESFPGVTAVEVDEVVNEAYPRLAKALEAVDPPTPADFFRLAAHKLRQTLLDLAADFRRRAGAVPVGPGGGSSGEGGVDPAQTTDSPVKLAAWTELHRRAGELPEDVRAVFTQHFYLGLTQAEIAEATGLTPKQVSRLWARAVLLLGDAIPDA